MKNLNTIILFLGIYQIIDALQMEKYLLNVLNVVRFLRRTLYHPMLDEIVDKGDADVDNLISYVELIGEGQFYTILGRINKTLLLAFNVCF